MPAVSWRSPWHRWAALRGWRAPSPSRCSSIATSGRCCPTTASNATVPIRRRGRPSCGWTWRAAPSASWTACGRSWPATPRPATWCGASPAPIPSCACRRPARARNSRPTRSNGSSAGSTREPCGKSTGLSFRPSDPPIPAVKAAASIRNPIDAFVLARLEAAGLAPSPEADKHALMRRVTLDLTGLPPTPAEVDAFLADTSPDAYERVVDRLLASPRYGERMAARWLDAARYADTNGYQDDGVRHMWRWRDWVIEAYNRNLPFDRFTIEQLAGDLLPRRHAGTADRHRLQPQPSRQCRRGHHPRGVCRRVRRRSRGDHGHGLAGADGGLRPLPRSQVRPDHAARVLPGSSPTSTTCRRRAAAIKVGNSPPHDQGAHARPAAAVADDRRTTGGCRADVCRFAGRDRRARGRLVRVASRGPADPLGTGRVAGGPLAAGRTNQGTGRRQRRRGGRRRQLRHRHACSRRACSTARRRSKPATWPTSASSTSSRIAAWILPQSDSGTLVARMREHAEADGYTGATGRRQAAGEPGQALARRRAARGDRTSRCRLDRWQHVAVTYDGSRMAPAASQVYVDGREQKLKVLLDELNQSFSVKEPLRIGGGGPRPAVQGHDRRRADLSAPICQPRRSRSWPRPSRSTRSPPNRRRSARRARPRSCRAYFLAHHAPRSRAAARERIVELRQQARRLRSQLPDHDGDGRDATAARNVRAGSRPVRQAGRARVAGRARGLATVAGDDGPNESPGASPAGWSIRRIR